MNLDNKLIFCCFCLINERKKTSFNVVQDFSWFHPISSRHRSYTYFSDLNKEEVMQIERFCSSVNIEQTMEKR
jgi:hypothetical protein